MRITDLGGHSGCQILLCEADDGKVFVRKISSSLEYNNRLINQANKQSTYKNHIIKAPVIFNEGYMEEGLYYYDMEYIQGITLAEYIKSIEIGDIRGVVEVLVNELVCNYSQDKIVEEQVFYDKITDLKTRLTEENNYIINEALEVLSNHSWHRFYISPCHGDLTLENIIIKDNHMYFIDFLDSFYNCWMMDIATLMQDVQTLWSYRFQDEVNINTIIRLIVFRDILIDKIKELVKDDYIEIYYALLLKLIRIYPYIKDEKTYSFLNQKVDSVMNIIKEEERICEL